MTRSIQTDVLIIGCGIAGATAALVLAQDRARRITILNRESDPEQSNSSWAQGGIVGRGRNDRPELLVGDVLRAGNGLSRPDAVRLLAEEGPRLVRELLIEQLGVEFDRNEEGELALGLEGAHSLRRILHVRDTTGRVIMRSILRRLAEQPNIELLGDHTAVDLLTFPHHALDPLAVYEPAACHGAYALERASGRVKTVLAGDTILATGGLGQIFLNTTNPPGSRGDGLAMAYRAGAKVVNTEYIQFHPTALHMTGTTKALISEAVRGEGAQLLTPDGEPFMQRHAPELKELATRDVVARAIYHEMLTNNYPYVMLDIASHQPAEFIRERFPEIHALCLEHEFDMSQRPIRVVPAAHYFCGGVLVDLWGRSTLPGLFCVGEVACSGVHGANRLASTSLLEGLVWGARAAEMIREQPEHGLVPENAVPGWDDSSQTFEADPALIQVDMQAIRNIMWHYVGLQRNEARLHRALRELLRLRQNIESFYRRAHLTDALLGLRNAVLNAVIISGAALQNTTTRGCHYREDSRPARGASSPSAANPAPDPGPVG